jgi:hypothetical protein
MDTRVKRIAGYLIAGFAIGWMVFCFATAIWAAFFGAWV